MPLAADTPEPELEGAALLLLGPLRLELQTQLVELFLLDGRGSIH